VVRRFRPLHGILLVAFFMAAVLVADWALDGGFRRSDFERVSPDRNGEIRLPVAALAPGDVRFYRFLNPGNQEVRFFVGRDRNGALQVAFDAAENDFKRKLGFRHEDGWLVNNKCETALRLEEVNAGTSGCRPAPLQHRLDGTTLVLTEGDVLRGWRFFL
jgi:uncharacterized membrane protein